jgi:hypothetical protein
MKRSNKKGGKKSMLDEHSSKTTINHHQSAENSYKGQRNDFKVSTAAESNLNPFPDWILL